jgi:hypothetical protein
VKDASLWTMPSSMLLDSAYSLAADRHHLPHRWPPPYTTSWNHLPRRLLAPPNRRRRHQIAVVSLQ